MIVEIVFKCIIFSMSVVACMLFSTTVFLHAFVLIEPMKRPMLRQPQRQDKDVDEEPLSF